jgi:hypothetical protein
MGGLPKHFGTDANVDETRRHAITDFLTRLSPIASLAIPHAALTGVLLFLAGLLSGYFDNKAAYDRIPERIAHLGWLRRLIGPQRADRFAGTQGLTTLLLERLRTEPARFLVPPPENTAPPGHY